MSVLPLLCSYPSIFLAESWDYFPLSWSVFSSATVESNRLWSLSVSAGAGLWLLHSGAGEEREGLRVQHPRRAGIQDGPVCPAPGRGGTGHPQRAHEGRFVDAISLNTPLLKRLSCVLSFWITWQTLSVIVWLLSKLGESNFSEAG